MDRWVLDVRATLRALRRSPGTAFIAVVALAMGIGFTTTMFSIVHGATRSLPFDEPEELVIVTSTIPRIGALDMGARPFDYQAWSADQHSFDALAAFATSATNLSRDGGSPERRDGALVTANAFGILGARAERGRLFTEADEAQNSTPVVIIGHDLWVKRYDSDPAIIGRVIRTDGKERTVIGVMPPGFAFPINAALWVPMINGPATDPEAGGQIRVFGRLADGVSIERASADIAATATRIREAYPDARGDYATRIYPFAESELPRELVRALYLMVGAVSFALLIACANVANLLLARAAARSRELVIRTALGASRRRVVGIHLVESLVLAGLGGVLGLAFATVAVRFFANATSSIIEAFWQQFRVDWTVVLFATLLVAIAAIAAGMAPGWRAASANAADALRDQSGGSTGLRIGRLSRTLVVVQLAFSCGLLIMTAVFVRSALGLRATAFPFETRDILTAQLGFTSAQLSDPAARNRELRDLMDGLSAVPGVRRVSMISALPGRGSGNWSFSLDGQSPDAGGASPYTSIAFITPDFPEFLGTNMDRGRAFTWQDDLDAPAVALVNRSWVERYSAGIEPIGRRVSIGSADFQVVGVLPDLMPQDVEDSRADGIYIPMLQWRGLTNVRLMTLASGSPVSLAQPIRDAIRVVDADLPVYEFATLYDAIFADKKVLDVFGILFFLFGIGALFMTVIGLYGVVAFAVNRRTREIGIRVALGAHRGDVIAMVVRQGSRQVLIGLAAGLAIAFGLSRAIAAAIEPIRPADPLTFGVVAAVLALTALLALIAPARRALRVQPVDALRSD
jgi:putative ABC transport system permease protein